jgi:hypothetical protein
MATDMDFRQIERKAWMSFFEDGLLDVFMGLNLLAVGIPGLLPSFFASELRQNAAYVALMVPALFVYWLGKRFITMPRIGRARFGPTRKSKQRKTAVLYSISVLAGLIVFLVFQMWTTGPSQGTPWSAPAVIALGIGAWMLLILGLASYFMDFTRGYVVAALYALAFSGTILLHNPIMLITAGAVATLMGLIVFVRFLRRYRKPAKVGFENNVQM